MRPSALGVGGLAIGLAVSLFVVVFAWSSADRPVAPDPPSDFAPAIGPTQHPDIREARVPATNEAPDPTASAPPPAMPKHWLFPTGTDRERLTEWGRRMIDNPDADVGILWCDYRLDVLRGKCPEEGVRTTPVDSMMQDAHLRTLEASQDVNPRGVILSEGARSDLRALIGSYRSSIIDANTATHIALMTVARDAIRTDRGYLVAPRVSTQPTAAEIEARQAFNDQIKPTADRIYTGIPGRGGADPEAQRGRMVIATRAEHPEVFRGLDEENRILADLDAAIRQYFASIR